jgi:hypothetical protein
MRRARPASSSTDTTHHKTTDRPVNSCINAPEAEYVVTISARGADGVLDCGVSRPSSAHASV